MPYPPDDNDTTAYARLARAFDRLRTVYLARIQQQASSRAPAVSSPRPAKRRRRCDDADGG